MFNFLKEWQINRAIKRIKKNNLKAVQILDFLGADTTQVKTAIRNGAYETASRLSTQAMKDMSEKL